MKQRLLLIFVCMSCLVSSCQMSLPLSRQQENLYPSLPLETPLAEALQCSLFEISEGGISPCWWEIFESENLNCLIAEALNQNPTLIEVEKRIEFARQEAMIARARLFPLLFFNASNSWEYLSQNGLYRALNPNLPLNAKLFDLSLSFDYEFDFWGKNRNLFYAAIGRQRVEEAEFAQAQLILTSALAQAYLSLKTQLAIKKGYEQLALLKTKDYELQLLLENEALSSTIETLLANEKRLEALKQVEKIEEDIAFSKHLINVLAGRSPESCLCAEEENLIHPFFPITCDLDLISRRPDLIAQIWRVKALSYEVGASIADFFPNINLSAFIGLESVSWLKFFQWGSKTAGVKPALSLPVFTAGSICANVRGKKALFDEAVWHYNQLILTSAQEVCDLLSFARFVSERKEEQEKIVECARKRQYLINLRSKNAIDNSFSDYTIEEDVILKEIDNTRLLYDQYIAMIKLIKALGGGFYACPPLQGSKCS